MRKADRPHWLQLAKSALRTHLTPSEQETISDGLHTLSEREITIMEFSFDYSLSWNALSILKDEELVINWCDVYGHWIRAQMPD